MFSGVVVSQCAPVSARDVATNMNLNHMHYHEVLLAKALPYTDVQFCKRNVEGTSMGEIPGTYAQ